LPSNTDIAVNRATNRYILSGTDDVAMHHGVNNNGLTCAKDITEDLATDIYRLTGAIYRAIYFLPFFDARREPLRTGYAYYRKRWHDSQY
jgi:hypothetical protein